jgi:hypothetical protein
MKAMRRVRGELAPLLDGFAEAELVHAPFEAILVDITDDKGPEFFEEIPNSDGFFQVVVGCSMNSSDAELRANVVDILHRAVSACPLSPTDMLTVQKVFDVCRR